MFSSRLILQGEDRESFINKKGANNQVSAPEKRGGTQ
jgi:hypothetical protein